MYPLSTLNMSPASTTYLITGANRGIGRGLADIVLSRPNTTLVALVRDLEHPTSKSLAANEAGASNTKVIVLPYQGTSETAATEAVSSLKSHGVTSLDVVIANAGAILARGPVTSLNATAMADHMAINCVAPVLLLQATLPLMLAAKEQHGGEPGYEPKFIAISSAIGSTGLIDKHMHAQAPAYGMSKAALNHVMRKAFLESKDIDIEMLVTNPLRRTLPRTRDANVFSPQVDARRGQDRSQP